MYPTSALSRTSRRYKTGGYAGGILAAFILIILMGFITSTSVAVGRADNFTDIFYTNSFRGAFDWIKKLDWVGMIVQCVISCFSLFGVALLVIRIMTSMLYLSAKGMWEEVHDLKGGGESDKDFIGLLGMAKTWASGKSGTGLDAVIGAVLILLPDVKKYSDFGEKAGGKFEEDISMTQYMLKILLPTVMTVFFFAMGFNGTLFQALAVTVDTMGYFADRAISINYAGFAEDLCNSTTGYKFAFKQMGTNEGKLKDQIAKDVYGRAVKQINQPNADQLYQLGRNVESWTDTLFGDGSITSDGSGTSLDGGGQAIANSTQISEKVKNGITNGSDPSVKDKYMAYLGYDIVINGAPSMNGATSIALNKEDGLYQGVSSLESTGENNQRAQYLHLFIKQTTDFNGNYFNVDDAIGDGTSGGGTTGGTTTR